MLGQGLVLVAALGIVGVWMGGIDVLDYVGTRRFGEHSSCEKYQHLIESIGHRVSTPLTRPTIPGVVIGQGGIYIGSSKSNIFPYHSPDEHEPELPSEPIQIWGVDLETKQLLEGLTTWPPNPPIDEIMTPLSSLGHFADNIYKLGPLTLPEYTDQLDEFVNVAFPEQLVGLQDGLRGLREANVTGESWDVEKKIWQTDKDTRHSDSAEVSTWKGPLAKHDGWNWEMLTDP